MTDVNRLRARRTHLRARRRALGSTQQGSKETRRQAIAAVEAELATLDAELVDADHREDLTVKVAAAAQLVAGAVAPGTSDLQSEVDALVVRDALRDLLADPEAQLFISAGHLLSAADALWEKAGPASKQRSSKKRRKATRGRRSEREVYYDMSGKSRQEIAELLTFLRGGAK
jgi:hypothetical protein